MHTHYILVSPLSPHPTLPTLHHTYVLHTALHREQHTALLDLLHNPTTETISHTTLPNHTPHPPYPTTLTAEIAPLPNLNDNTARALTHALDLLNIHPETLTTGRRLTFPSQPSPQDLQNHLRDHSNPLLHQHALNPSPQDLLDLYIHAKPHTAPPAQTIPLRSLSPQQLTHLSTSRGLALNLPELQRLQTLYTDLQRDPTDVELETFAQTWSEHCSHKTFRAHITYTENQSNCIEIDGLLDTYIKSTYSPTQHPWVRSAFDDNAGIVSFCPGWDLALKVETHNRPSALDPFGGANTGVGGVMRDILGVSARPFANTDALFFGPLDTDPTTLPDNTLHPQHIHDGVIHGIEDYGNKTGVPTIAGSITFHPDYASNPLVFCGSFGLLPHNTHPTSPQPGDLIILLGAPTGRDGIHGATFSSMNLARDTSTRFAGAVQLGCPEAEKQLIEIITHARDQRLYSAITDCGAGGLSSAIGELARSLGADVHLDRVPLKHGALTPWEIWVSESQERMVLSVPPHHLNALHTLCTTHKTSATHIGTFRDDRTLSIFMHNQPVAQMDTHHLFELCPPRSLEARWSHPTPTPNTNPFPNPTDALLALLSAPNIHSREPTIRRYDFEVQNSAVVRPLVGVLCDAPSDGAVLHPLETAREGHATCAAISLGSAPHWSAHDPAWMAWESVSEAVRSCVILGANPDRIALLDNFAWGDPRDPETLGSLVRCAQACSRAARAYAAPFVSGKDSLYNATHLPDGSRRDIPGTLVIHAVGPVDRPEHAHTSDFKHTNSAIYLFGPLHGHLGGSQLNTLHPTPHTTRQPQWLGLPYLHALHDLTHLDTTLAAHDVSQGGLLVALAESLIGGHSPHTPMGLHLNLPNRTDHTPQLLTALLFGELGDRVILEVAPHSQPLLERCIETHFGPHHDLLHKLGETNASGVLTIEHHSVHIEVDRLRDAFERTPPPTPETKAGS